MESPLRAINSAVAAVQKITEPRSALRRGFEKTKKNVVTGNGLPLVSTKKTTAATTAASSQHLKVGNCAAKLLPRASKAAQRFCIPLQLELSSCSASKML